MVNISLFGYLACVKIKRAKMHTHVHNINDNAVRSCLSENIT